MVSPPSQSELNTDSSYVKTSVDGLTVYTKTNRYLAYRDRNDNQSKDYTLAEYRFDSSGNFVGGYNQGILVNFQKGSVLQQSPYQEVTYERLGDGTIRQTVYEAVQSGKYREQAKQMEINIINPYGGGSTQVSYTANITPTQKVNAQYQQLGSLKKDITRTEFGKLPFDDPNAAIDRKRLLEAAAQEKDTVAQGVKRQIDMRFGDFVKQQQEKRTQQLESQDIITPSNAWTQRVVEGLKAVGYSVNPNYQDTGFISAEREGSSALVGIPRYSAIGSLANGTILVNRYATESYGTGKAIFRPEFFGNINMEVVPLSVESPEVLGSVVQNAFNKARDESFAWKTASTFNKAFDLYGMTLFGREGGVQSFSTIRQRAKPAFSIVATGLKQNKLLQGLSNVDVYASNTLLSPAWAAYGVESIRGRYTPRENPQTWLQRDLDTLSAQPHYSFREFVNPNNIVRGTLRESGEVVLGETTRFLQKPVSVFGEYFALNEGFKAFGWAGSKALRLGSNWAGVGLTVEAASKFSNRAIFTGFVAGSVLANPESFTRPQGYLQTATQFGLYGIAFEGLNKLEGKNMWNLKTKEVTRLTKVKTQLDIKTGESKARQSGVRWVQTYFHNPFTGKLIKIDSIGFDVKMLALSQSNKLGESGLSDLKGAISVSMTERVNRQNVELFNFSKQKSKLGKPMTRSVNVAYDLPALRTSDSLRTVGIGGSRILTFENGKLVKTRRSKIEVVRQELDVLGNVDFKRIVQTDIKLGNAKSSSFSFMVEKGAKIDRWFTTNHLQLKNIPKTIISDEGLGKTALATTGYENGEVVIRLRKGFFKNKGIGVDTKRIWFDKDYRASVVQSTPLMEAYMGTQKVSNRRFLESTMFHEWLHGTVMSGNDWKGLVRETDIYNYRRLVNKGNAEATLKQRFMYSKAGGLSNDVLKTSLFFDVPGGWEKSYANIGKDRYNQWMHEEVLAEFVGAYMSAPKSRRATYSKQFPSLTEFVERTFFFKPTKKIPFEFSIGKTVGVVKSTVAEPNVKEISTLSKINAKSGIYSVEVLSKLKTRQQWLVDETGTPLGRYDITTTGTVKVLGDVKASGYVFNEGYANVLEGNNYVAELQTKTRLFENGKSGTRKGLLQSFGKVGGNTISVNSIYSDFTRKGTRAYYTTKLKMSDVVLEDTLRGIKLEQFSGIDVGLSGKKAKIVYGRNYPSGFDIAPFDVNLVDAFWETKAPKKVTVESRDRFMKTMSELDKPIARRSETFAVSKGAQQQEIIVAKEALFTKYTGGEGITGGIGSMVSEGKNKFITLENGRQNGILGSRSIGSLVGTLRNRNRPVIKPGMGLINMQRINPALGLENRMEAVSRGKTKSAIDTETKSATRTTQRQKTIGKFVPPNVIVGGVNPRDGLPIVPNIPPPTIPPDHPPHFIKKNDDQLIRRLKPKRIGVTPRRKFKYTSSLVAAEFNIRGKAPKLLSGIEIRPLRLRR